MQRMKYVRDEEGGKGGEVRKSRRQEQATTDAANPGGFVDGIHLQICVPDGGQCLPGD